MSAVAGMVFADGRPVSPVKLHGMLKAMAHRGPHGQAIWRAAGVGLAQGLLRSLPEAPDELPPLVQPDLVVAADVRLDNREDLVAALQLSPELSDTALLAAAYRRWGEACPERLMGDFAFAVWDGARKLLFCARDHFGVKPFHYHLTPGTFAFASEIKALRALPELSFTVDDCRVAEFLAGVAPDTVSTPYREVLRLPPGHAMTIQGGASRVWPYWRLEPSAEIARGDLPEQFQEIFGRAVRSRLRSAAPVGAMLSGGLDSSSIACVAAPMVAAEQHRPLPTYSMVFDQTPKWNERPFIEAALAQGDMAPRFLACDSYAPLAEFDDLLSEQDGLFLAPGLALTRRLYRTAAEQGTGVLLDGHGGDEVVSHGYGRLQELASAGRWLALWGETKGLAGTYGDPHLAAFALYVAHYSPLRKVVRARRRARALAARLGAGRRPEPRTAWPGFINPDLAQRAALGERVAASRPPAGRGPQAERDRHLHVLSGALQPYALEVLDRAAASAGLEARYPFWDKRLVEFCLALPSEEKLAGGWTRLILRRAMQDRLPPAIQWRRDKLDFSPHLVRGLAQHHRDLIESALEAGREDLDAFVDRTAVRNAYRRVVEAPDSASASDVQAVWRTIALFLWTRQLNSAPQPRAAVG